jgi:hypothetical protein
MLINTSSVYIYRERETKLSMVSRRIGYGPFPVYWLCGSGVKHVQEKRENKFVSHACRQLALGKFGLVINGPVHVGN